MVRTYGEKPYEIALLHGGPGAPGTLRGLAEELSDSLGVLEPIQSKYTIAKLIDELHNQIEEHTKDPIVLMGHSWGAWLGVLFVEAYPERVNHLVLVGSGPFEPRYVPLIGKRRQDNLSLDDRMQFDHLLHLSEEGKLKSDSDLAALGELAEKADNYSPLKEDFGPLPVNGEMYDSIWTKAAKLRNEGYLREALSRIGCPVTVIHGDRDPHPAEGVIEPLLDMRINPQVYLLEKCGHSPFKEQYAKDLFLEILKRLVYTERKNSL